MAADSSPADAKSVISTFEAITKQFAGVATLLLCVSVFYDFSYFAAVGLTFAEVPTTVADHLRSALVWAPGTACCIIGLSVVVVFVRLAVGESIAEQPLQRPRRTWHARLLEDWPMYGALAAGLTWAVVAERSYLAAYMMALGVWQYLAESVVDHPTFGKPFRSGARLIPLLMLIVVPQTVIGVGGWGYYQGQSAARATMPAWQLTLKGENGHPEEVREYAAVRRFSEVSLAVGTRGEVTLIPSEQLVLARKLNVGSLHPKAQGAASSASNSQP